MMQMGWYKAEQWYVHTCLNYLLETELNGRVGHTIMHENHSRDGIQVGGYKTEQWYVYTCSNYLLETVLNCKASHTIMHENHCRDGTQMGGCITNSVTYMSHPISELWAWTNRITCHKHACKESEVKLEYGRNKMSACPQGSSYDHIGKLNLGSHLCTYVYSELELKS